MSLERPALVDYRNNGKAFGTNSMVLRRLMNDMIEGDQTYLPYLD